MHKEKFTFRCDLFICTALHFFQHLPSRRASFLFYKLFNFIAVFGLFKAIFMANAGGA